MSWWRKSAACRLSGRLLRFLQPCLRHFARTAQRPMPAINSRLCWLKPFSMRSLICPAPARRPPPGLAPARQLIARRTPFAPEPTCNHASSCNCPSPAVSSGRSVPPVAGRGSPYQRGAMFTVEGKQQVGNFIAVWRSRLPVGSSANSTSGRPLRLVPAPLVAVHRRKAVPEDVQTFTQP